MVKNIVAVIVVGIFLLAGIFLWGGVYRIETLNGYSAYKINKFTGHTWYLMKDRVTEASK